MLRRTLKNYALWKNFSKCIKFGPSQRTLKKNSVCVIICHFNALGNFFEYQILHGSLYFPCLKISNTIIKFENKSNLFKWFINDSVNCMFIYQVVCIMQIETFCQRFSHTRFIGFRIVSGIKVLFPSFLHKNLWRISLSFFLNRNIL